MYPHEGSGESAQPTNYLQPLPPAIPPAHHGGHAAPDIGSAQSAPPERPRDSGVLGKLGFGRSASNADPPERRGPSGSMPHRPLLLGDLLAAAASILLFLASFAPFVSYDSAKLTDDLKKLDLSTWFTAWSAQTFMAPLTWFVVLSALLVAAISALRYLRGSDREVLTFSLPQLQLVLSLFAAVTLIGYAASRKSVLFGADYAAVVGKAPATTAFDTRLSLSFGGYLMLLAALVAVVGALLNVLGVERVVLPRPAKQTPAPRPAPRTDSPFYGAAAPTSGSGAHAQPDPYGPVSGMPSPPQNAPQWDATQPWDSGNAPSWETAQPERTALYGQVPDDPPSYQPNPVPYEPRTQPYEPTAVPREPDPLTDPSYGEQSRRQNPPGTVYGRPPN